MRRFTFALPLLAGVVLLGGCGSSGSQDSAATAPGGPVTVDAGDAACTLGRTALSPGINVFKIKNVGDKVTEVYLYSAGDTVVAEKENIGPGLSVELTAKLAAGNYEVACKPGMTGDGIRTKITVTG